MTKTRQKLIKKFVNLTGHIPVCNSLTNFEYEVHTVTGNGNLFESAEIYFEKIVKIHQVNLFSAGF